MQHLLQPHIDSIIQVIREDIIPKLKKERLDDASPFTLLEVDRDGQVHKLIENALDQLSVEDNLALFEFFEDEVRFNFEKIMNRPLTNELETGIYILIRSRVDQALNDLSD